MITNYSVSNFKSFSEKIYLPLHGLITLTGINSTGKSALIQSLLLLKQSFENKKTLLDFDGTYVKLGSFKDIVYNHDLNKEITFSLTFEQLLTRTEHKSSMLNRFYKIVSNVVKNASKVEMVITFSVKEINKQIKVTFYEVSYQFLLENSEPLQTIFQLKMNPDETYFVTIENLPNELKDVKTYTEKQFPHCEVTFSSIFPFEIHGDFRDYTGNFSEVPALYAHAVSDVVEDAFQHFSYLGPLRSAPRRRYAYDSPPNEVEPTGENIYFFYNRDKDKTISYYKSIHLSASEEKLKDAVNYWFFDQFHMSKAMRTNELDENLLSVQMTAGTESDLPINLTHVGVGISQVLPFIIEGLRAQKGTYLIIEQPEIHLHPFAQGVLADFVLCLIKKGVSVIVETHSEHFINRLRRRIVEDRTGEIIKNCHLFFVVNPGGKGAQLNRIEIDEFGMIANWPKGFFDQGENELRELFKAQMERRRDQK